MRELNSGRTARRSSRRAVPVLSEALEARELLSTFGAKSVDPRPPAIIEARRVIAPPQVVQGGVEGTQAMAQSRGPTSGDAATDTTTFTVPLNVVRIGKQRRLSVDVSVAGSGLRPYLLDTGSSGMYVSQSGLKRSSYTATQKAFLQSYSSGLEYLGIDINTGLSFAQGPTASNARVGMIEFAKGKTIGRTWQRNLDNNKPPYSRKFWGTLGMSLEPGKKERGSLYSIIAQMPGNLNSGFIIHTGGPDGKGASLTVGLTPANAQGFTVIPLVSAGSRGSTYRYGNGLKNHVLAWDDKQAKILYKITGIPPFTLRTIFDTGNPGTTIYDSKIPASKVQKGGLPANLEFQANLAPGVTWKFRTGQTINKNQVWVVRDRKKKEAVNSGIALFFNYDVMYDIVGGQIGFRPDPGSGS
jgi:hypothetical protein